MSLGVNDLRRGRRDDVPERWSSHVEGLRQRLSAELGGVDVEVTDVRPRSRWLVLSILVPPRRRLFAKLALPGPDLGSSVQRPRLVPISDPACRLQSEAEALRRLTDRMPEDDPDLASVSVVHWEQSPPVLVVDWVEGKALSQSLSPVTLPPRRPRPRAELLRAAGRWLNLFHSLIEDEPLAYKYPEDVVNWLAEVEEYLAERPRTDRWRVLVDELVRAIGRHQSLNPEIGLHHGDMAPRNLMVRDDGRIVGIDAGVSWRAPRAHDLGVFLVDLHLRSTVGNGVRGHDFFNGYGAPADQRWVADLFSAIAVVDREVAWSARDEEGMGTAARRALEGVRLNSLTNRLTERLRSI